MNKKGFTLVEIIVVIVILAVLMAVAVPSVLGYISEADNAKLMAQARSVLTTAQAEVVKKQASGDGLVEGDLAQLNTNVGKSLENEINDLTVTEFYVGKVTVNESNGTVSGTTMANADKEDQTNKITQSLSAVTMTIGNKQVTAVTNDKVYVSDKPN